MTELTKTDLDEIKFNIEARLEEFSLESLKQEPRTHLGISEIGENCSRKLWYKFRWFAFEEFSGRMLRLFQRGHREEERYINYLEAIGCKVYRFYNPILNYHPESDDYFLSSQFEPGDGLVEDVTGLPRHEDEATKRGLKRQQFRVAGVNGHYGGSCDGVVILPWYPDIPFIGEFKTHNAKSFIGYVNDGLVKSKPKHYDQMCGYGYHMQIQYGLYFPENKNDDDIQVTPIKLDWNRGRQLELKAHDIITAKEPPQRISDNPSFFECKYCTFTKHCHEQAIPQKNCRSCRMSEPVENAEWKCNLYKDIIDKEFIKKGCEQWAPI